MYEVGKHITLCDFAEFFALSATNQVVELFPFFADGFLFIGVLLKFANGFLGFGVFLKFLTDSSALQIDLFYLLGVVLNA